MLCTIFKNIQKKVSAVLCIALLAGTFAFVPMSHTGTIQKAEAFGGPVTVVGGPGSGAGLKTAFSTSLQAALQDAFYIKEFTMDGILNGLAKMVLKSMTQSILTWINSGFQGSPAFVTDLKQFMLDRADQAVGDFIYNDPSLNFLCSPFQLDVKIALATAYQKQEHEGFGSEAQCTLSNVTDNVEGFLSGSFNEGGWGSWFEVTQNPVNTPTGAYLAAEEEMYARIVDDEGNTIKELDWGNGVLSFKVCSDAQQASGNRQNCSITTPGKVIADQINKTLGAGQDALIAADEVNEIIGALFAQIAKQAITGINGLLGLSGGSQYSDNQFGEESNQAYLDALQDEQTTSDTLSNPLEGALVEEEKSVVLNNTIIQMINDVEGTLRSAIDVYGICISITMPEEVNLVRENAILKTIISSSTINILTTLNAQYTTTDDPNELLSIIEIYNKMVADGLVQTRIDNSNTQLLIDFDLQPALDEFTSQISTAVGGCSI